MMHIIDQLAAEHETLSKITAHLANGEDDQARAELSEMAWRLAGVADSLLITEEVKPMTTGENVQMLSDGGYTRQALNTANAESVSIEEYPAEHKTVFIFADGSTYTIYGLALITESTT